MLRFTHMLSSTMPRRHLMLLGATLTFAIFLVRYFGDGSYGYRYSVPYNVLFLCGTFVALLATRNVFRSDKARLVASKALVAATAAYAVFSFYIGIAYEPDQMPYWLCAVIQCSRSTVMALVFSFWNIQFALNKPRDASNILVPSMLLALIGASIVSHLGSSALYLAHSILPFLSCLAYAKQEKDHSSNPADPYSVTRTDSFDSTSASSKPGETRTRILFFGSRIIWGLVFGIAFAFASSVPTAASTAGPSAVWAVALGAIVLALSHFDQSPEGSTLWLFVLFPTLITGLAYILFQDMATSKNAMLPVAVMWLAWHYQSFLQLPTYRQLTRLGTVSFAFAEKSALFIAFSASNALCGQLLTLPALSEFQAALASFPFFVMIAMTLVSSAVVLRHVVKYFPNTGFAKPASDGFDSQTENRIALLASSYGLSKREEEVAKLLSEGYSRPYIEKALYISKGTAKTHIHHIYQKLGVSSQDELIELVSQR